MPIPSWVYHPFLVKHLKYVEQTESPVLMHIWGAISAAGAAMGRHSWLETGIGHLYPNMYILLVGPPGTRKNAAINYPVKLLKKHTEVKFAPDDTGGQRQGLIVAMEDTKEFEDDPDLARIKDADMITQMSVLGNAKMNLSKEDKHTLYICATEFGSFLGQGSLDMTRFLIKMWDGEDYKYRIRNNRNVLTDPLLNLIGGTTPSDLSSLLPPEAIGQGFMSRIVLCFAPNKEQRVPRPVLNRDMEGDLIDVYKYLFYDHRGGMTESETAQKLFDKIYMQDVQIPDTRFIYYTERRQAHLTKLAMVLAAARKSMEIEEQDIQQAVDILTRTEYNMPNALGEYGLSPTAIAKQKMMEYIQYAKGPVGDSILWAVMRRDMRLIDFKNCIHELLNAGKIVQVDTNRGPAYIHKDDMGILEDANDKEEIENLLGEMVEDYE